MDPSVACLVKKSYDTLEEAITAGSRVGYQLRPYFCPWCSKYHLTKASPDKFKYNFEKRKRSKRGKSNRKVRR